MIAGIIKVTAGHYRFVVDTDIYDIRRELIGIRYWWVAENLDIKKPGFREKKKTDLVNSIKEHHETKS